MRDILNGILTLIGASSLTDDEWNALSLGESPSQIEIYHSLLSLLQARESVSDTISRLKFYFKAKGVQIEDSPTAVSNILVGACL